MARGPAQKLGGLIALYDVPFSEFEATARAYSTDPDGSLNSARAHHRQAETFVANYVLCIHCQRRHAVVNRAALEEHRKPPVVWCWSCFDWRCNTAACAGCERASRHRLRAIEAVEGAVHGGARVSAALFLACVDAGLPGRGMDLDEHEGIAVATRRKPNAPLVIAAA